MAIRQRYDGWQVDVFIKGHKRVRLQVQGSKADARKLEDEIIHQLRTTGEYTPKGQAEKAEPRRGYTRPTLLRDGLARAKAAWATSAGENYAKNAERNVREFVEALGLEDVELDAIGYDEIGKALTYYRRKGLADATINFKLSAVSKVYAVSRRKPALTIAHPEFGEWRQKGLVEADRILTEAEEEAMVPFFRGIGREDFADVCILALDLALHITEVTSLKVDHFEGLEGDSPTCHVPGTKTEYRAAALPMTPRAVEAAKRRIAHARANRRKLLFPEWQAKNRYKRTWNRFRDYLGLQDDPFFTFKVLRHTCGTRLADMDVNAFKIRDFMRHGQIATTERYIHGSRKRLKGLAEGLASRRFTQVVTQD